MQLFYCPHVVLNEPLALDEAESHHISKVLRKVTGEELFVFDGQGNLYESRIVSIDKKQVIVNPVRLCDTPTNNKPKLHLGMAIPKNAERLEWLVEKATEIGIQHISLVDCQRSERRTVRLDRLEKIAISACKQSMQYHLPRIDGPIKLREFLLAANGTATKYIAYCDAKAIHLKDAYHGGFDTIVLVGPEGDFTYEEVKQAENCGFETVSLGANRLRMETAALYATTLFNIVNEK